MGKSRVLHIGLVAHPVAAPGFDCPQQDRFPAKEGATKTLPVAGAGPQLLLRPGAFYRPGHGLTQGAGQAVIDPYHQIDVAPFYRAGAVVVAVQHPAWRGAERRLQLCEHDLVRGALPVRTPVQSVHFDTGQCQFTSDPAGQRALTTAAGANNIDFHHIS
ncbi:hypothetical protein D3C76_1443290 [compost metagenome]